MRPYEIVIIFDAGLDEGVIRSVTDRIAETARSRGGNSGRVDRWGERTLAYELAHRREGYYVLVEVTVEPEVVSEIDRMLTLSDEVLRHKVIRQPERRGQATSRRSEPASTAAEEPAAS